MDRLYPFVCIPLRGEDRNRDEHKTDVSGSPRTERQNEEPVADLPREIWTRPLTQREADGLILIRPSFPLLFQTIWSKLVFNLRRTPCCVNLSNFRKEALNCRVLRNKFQSI